MQLTGAVAAMALLGAGCGEGQPRPDSLDASVELDAAIDAPKVCDRETRDDDYIPGMSKLGANGYRVTLATSAPAPRPRGNYAWTVQIHDPAMAARDGLAITVVPTMPDHHHGTSVQAVVTPSGRDGLYAIEPVNLFMTGLWAIRLGLSDGTTELDYVAYRFCVD